MSIESYNQFQKAVMQDSALQEQFKTAAATSPESLGELAVELGAERGYSFTLEEIRAVVEDASSSTGAEERLKDEELEMVSGGVTPLTFTPIGITTHTDKLGGEPTPPSEYPEWRVMRG